MSTADGGTAAGGDTTGGTTGPTSARHHAGTDGLGNVDEGEYVDRDENAPDHRGTSADEPEREGGYVDTDVAADTESPAVDTGEFEDKDVDVDVNRLPPEEGSYTDR